MSVTVFYSWQSDTRAAANRTLIQRSLEDSLSEISDDDSLALDPAIDRDTVGVAGAPDISNTILRKIDASAAFVADVTIVNSEESSRPMPNPNVLIELGYALKALGDSQIVLVQNTAFGGPELLPFDLRQKRVLTYHSATDAESRAIERKQLQSQLREALTLVLADLANMATTASPVELHIDYSRLRIQSARHDYRLEVNLRNCGTEVIANWHVDLEMPTILLDPNVTYSLAIPDRSDQDRTLFRATNDTHPGAIFPGDSKQVMLIDYHVDHDIFEGHSNVFDQYISAVAYVDGEIGATVRQLVSDLNVF